MMKSCSQFAIIRERSASTFEEKLNNRLEELVDDDTEVTFSDVDGDMVARIHYKKKVQFERPSEPMSETGIRFTCADCPCLEPVYNQKGEINGVIKYGHCPYSKYGKTYKTSPACDVLYNMIMNGEARLCLSESE